MGTVDCEDLALLRQKQKLWHVSFRTTCRLLSRDKAHARAATSAFALAIQDLHNQMYMIAAGA